MIVYLSDFIYYFNPFTEVLFHLSLTVLVRYRLSGLVRLRGWFPQLHSTFSIHEITHSFFAGIPMGLLPAFMATCSKVLGVPAVEKR